MVSMDGAAQRKAISSGPCEVRFDDLTRRLYATDASIYQIEPFGVAFPRTAQEASHAMLAAAEAEVSIIPRCGGTGLAGGAVGPGLVIDLARYNRKITDLDIEQRTVRVGAGVVLDQLNTFLAPHGFCYGPDVATSSRATLGGMISNNSSGARAPIYGTTSEHVQSLEVILADGSLRTVGGIREGLEELRIAVDGIVSRVAPEVDARFPSGICKRWPGYGFDRYLRGGRGLTKILAGSEGTLAAIWSAELNIVPLPKEKGVALFFFASVPEAMQATVEFLDLKPAAIEHMDRALFGQTRGQHAFTETRRFLRLDEEPCEAILIVEFYDHVAEKLAALEQRTIGLRSMMVTEPSEMAMVWNLRKAGLSLLTGRKGSIKPTAGVEDVAVRPEQLPAYVDSLREIMKCTGVEASYYGHAASGLLHVRPVVDLHTAEGVAAYRKVAEEVSALARQFNASLASEHGVGIARTEFLPEHLGPELMNAMRAVKQLFDPNGLMNPGKILPSDKAGPFRIDTNLRMGAGYLIHLPFTPVLAFAEKDGSFVGNLEQCNGCGGCRQDVPTMCPTYQATGDELMSTRGRANILRATLEGRFSGNGQLLLAAELSEALNNCLSCKACAVECPSNVNMPLLKAEVLHAKHQQTGVTLRERMISGFDAMGQLASMTPRIANAFMNLKPVRVFMEQAIGFTSKRPFPRFARKRFDRWFAQHTPTGAGGRGNVVLWDDASVRYCEPEVGIAAVSVLEAAGYRVRLLKGRKCDGRPAFSTGRLDIARKYGEHNVRLFRQDGTRDPIIFLEPSSYSMFVQDYRELGIADTEDVSARCVLFEQFVYELLEKHPDALHFKNIPTNVAIHTHCHAKALADPAIGEKLLRKAPGCSVSTLKTGCCGMAGQFGQLREKYELSIQVGKLFAEQVGTMPAGARLIANGTSCRNQANHLTSARPEHIAQFLASILAE